mgnify:CR=1 FL=1
MDCTAIVTKRQSEPSTTVCVDGADRDESDTGSCHSDRVVGWMWYQ